MTRLQFFILLLLLMGLGASCSNPQNNEKEVQEIVHIESVDLFLDSLEVAIDGDVQLYIDSVLRTFSIDDDILRHERKKEDRIYESELYCDVEEFFLLNPEEKDWFNKFVNAIKKGDTVNYDYLYRTLPLRDREIDYTPFVLYMYRKSDFVDVYWSIVSSLSCTIEARKSRNRKDYNDLNIPELTESELKLLIWSYIRAYKKGDGRPAIALSGYFKQGVYFFPKDTTTAKELYSLGLARIDSVIKLKEEKRY